MRWIEPKDGDIKVKKKFVIIPITINGETRWLEWVTVKYRYHERIAVWTNGEYYVETGWFPEEFIDENN